MFEYMKKSLLTGVGLALRSKKEIEELAKEFADQGKMDQKEGRKFLDDLMDNYDEAREKLDKKVESTVEKILEKADIPRRSDIKKLKEEIREIKTMLDDVKTDDQG
jgi:polyhydroxyalkanoate synthesis regulator phasin